jgi:hypothetical protein
MQLKARANLSTGKFMTESSMPLFDPVRTSIVDGRVDFQITGNRATAEIMNASFDDFTSLLNILYYSFPVFLNVLIPESPYALYAWGTVGLDKFQFQFEPTEVRCSATVTSKEGQEERVTLSWRRALKLSAHRRVLNGLHYFHVATRLLEVGFNRFEFMSESLQNIAKALQSIFGESRDSVRAELVKLGYQTDEIERRFIPYLVLRNEFDVSHVNLAMLTREQFKTLHEYSDQAEATFRGLFQRLLEKVDSGKYAVLPDTKSSLSQDRIKVLEKLTANLNR